jgi:hypothetical protein
LNYDIILGSIDQLLILLNITNSISYPLFFFTNKVKVNYYKIKLYITSNNILRLAKYLKSLIIDYELILALILKLVCVLSDLKLSIINFKLIYINICINMYMKLLEIIYKIYYFKKI